MTKEEILPLPKSIYEYCNRMNPDFNEINLLISDLSFEYEEKFGIKSKLSQCIILNDPWNIKDDTNPFIILQKQDCFDFRMDIPCIKYKLKEPQIQYAGYVSWSLEDYIHKIDVENEDLNFIIFYGNLDKSTSYYLKNSSYESDSTHVVIESVIKELYKSPTIYYNLKFTGKNSHNINNIIYRLRMINDIKIYESKISESVSEITFRIFNKTIY